MEDDDELKSQLADYKEQICRLESLKQSLAEREQIIRDRIKEIETTQTDLQEVRNDVNQLVEGINYNKQATESLKKTTQELITQQHELTKSYVYEQATNQAQSEGNPHLEEAKAMVNELRCQFNMLKQISNRKTFTNFISQVNKYVSSLSLKDDVKLVLNNKLDCIFKA
jgi:chromosome segregation ATPase